MFRTLAGILICAGTVFAQADKAQFKKEAAALQAAVEEAVNSVVPGLGVIEHPRAARLEGYGVVVSLQASFEPTRNPFSSPKTPEEVRKIVTQRRKDVQAKLDAVLKQHVVNMQSVGTTESLSIVLHLFNSNPADLPDFPSQILLTVKKQDPAHVTVSDF